MSPAESVKKLYEIAGIPHGNSSTLDIRIGQMADQMHECPSCLDDFPLSEMVALNCCHLYCSKCLKDYVSMQINEGASECIKCPGYKCKFIMDEIMLSSLLNTEDYEKYIRFLANSYVEKHPHIKWCPAKGCGLAIQQQGTQTSSMVMCRCGLLWCWKCAKDGHWPASCDQLKWWNDIYAKDDHRVSFETEEEAQSVRWLLKYTQDCPKCTAPIQKNGGCNHMSCKKCGMQYCWVCLDTWQSSHYSCSNSNNTTNDERAHILSRIESNLTFRQFYLINLKARQSNDKDVKNQLVRTMQALISEKPDEVNDNFIAVVCRAIEFNYLSRHIVLHVCILGKYMQEHKIKGSKLLKTELKRLSASISFLQSSIDVHWKKFEIQDVLLGTTGLKTAIREFMKVFTIIYRQQKAAFEEAVLQDKAKPKIVNK